METDNAARSEETPAAAVKRELSRVSEHTAKLLGAAGDTAASVVADAKGEAARITGAAQVEVDAMRADADRYAERTRSEADEFARQTRGSAYSFAQDRRRQAEVDAEGHVADAREEAQHLIETAQGRQAALFTVIADLSERRETLLSQLERIADSLGQTASRHREDAAPLDPVPDEGQAFLPPRGPAWSDVEESGNSEGTVVSGWPDPLEELGEDLEAEDLEADLEAEDFGEPAPAFDGVRVEPAAEDKAGERKRRGWLGRRSSPWLPPRGLDADAVPSKDGSPPG